MSFQQGIPDLESSWTLDPNDVKIFKEIGHGTLIYKSHNNYTDYALIFNRIRSWNAASDNG